MFGVVRCCHEKFVIRFKLKVTITNADICYKLPKPRLQYAVVYDFFGWSHNWLFFIVNQLFSVFLLLIEARTEKLTFNSNMMVPLFDCWAIFPKCVLFYGHVCYDLSYFQFVANLQTEYFRGIKYFP